MTAPEDKEQYEWEVNKADLAEYARRREAFASDERNQATAAVSKALSTYRWWGLTNLVAMTRIYIQRLRFQYRYWRSGPPR